MDKVLTPLQEHLTERATLIEDGAKESGSRGAMFRLVKRLDPDILVDWLQEEAAQDTSLPDIANAFHNYIANLLAIICIPFAPNHLELSATILNNDFNTFAKIAEDGDGKTVVIVDTKTGTEHVATIEGLVKYRMPK